MIILFGFVFVSAFSMTIACPAHPISFSPISEPSCLYMVVYGTDMTAKHPPYLPPTKNSGVRSSTTTLIEINCMHKLLLIPVGESPWFGNVL